MMPEDMSLVDQRTTESVWHTKSSKAVKQVEVMFSGQQGSLVQSVSILTREAIQAVEQVEVVFGGQQDSN